MIQSHQAWGHSLLCPRGWTLTCPLHGYKSKSSWGPFPFDHSAKVLRTTKCHANSIFGDYRSRTLFPKDMTRLLSQMQLPPCQFYPCPSPLTWPTLYTKHMPPRVWNASPKGKHICRSPPSPKAPLSVVLIPCHQKTSWRKYTIYKSEAVHHSEDCHDILHWPACTAWDMNHLCTVSTLYILPACSSLSSCLGYEIVCWSMAVLC